MSETTDRPTSWELLRSWLRVSLQSFGGGTATLALIRQEFVTKHEWISEDRFLRDWALCQLAPGINLVALSILIGKRTRGGRGVLISLCGLMLPSFLLTVLLTAAYARFLHTPLVNNALKGVVPAVAGIGLATALGMAMPVGQRFWQGRKGELAAYALMLIACAGVTLIWHPATAVILLGGGMFGAVLNFVTAGRRKETESSAP